MSDDPHLIDLVADELGLARAQIDAGLASLAEGTLRRRLARIEADGGADDEADALRLLLAEALWRQGRSTSARQALDGIRPSSPQRRLPMALLIDAETLANAGEADRAAGAQERLLAAIGVDEAFALRGGVEGRLAWPLPSAIRAAPAEPVRPPWSQPAADADGEAGPGPEDERVAAGRARLEEARVAYVAGDLERGDTEMSLAIRLDPALAPDGVAIIEPTLGRQAAAERLLLYGDLLRAAGREVEATDAYDRAASRRSRSTRTGRRSS
ncbi:MAG TPA: hypothetical protein VFN76_03070 [Candidatus Limnocylindria bacterium]|nr:hypothetical protein [Candidatus Limnocylindria bacterium]